MILNTGNRTDIPAYYSEWFYNRIKEGFVYVRNPYYPNQVQRFVLSPELVDCIIFCTKNPAPMLPRIEEFSAFRQFWQVTITPYGTDVEPYVPEKNKVMDSLKRLSERFGVEAVSWRYDPIFISEKYSLDFHLETFEKMAENLRGYVDQCVISFIDLYAKTKRNFHEVQAVNVKERAIIGEKFAEIGKAYGILIRSCCEGTELQKYGINVDGCMTKAVIERAIGATLDIPGKMTRAREECDCLLGNDIGMYNTCGHGCLYCYANYDRKTVEENMRLHNPKSPFLIGEQQPQDVIKDVKQESYYNGQLTLFNLLKS